MKSIDIDNVSKSYGDVKAVSDLSLDVPEGKIYGLLGPNGAGKTTTIRMIMDIIKPDSGTIRIFGEPNTFKMRDTIGYLPEERGLYKKMQVQDVVTYFAELKSVPAKESQPRAESWLKRLELYDWRDKKIEELSRGMQQKLQIICTILHEPKVLILDEPFTGLDPVNTALIKDVILELKAQGTTIIFSTHLMDQVEKLCESICLINKGQSVLKGTLSEVKARFGKNRIKMRYDGDSAFLQHTDLVSTHDNYGKYVEITPAAGVSSQQILQHAIQHVTVEHFEVSEPSLNEIFINVVQN